MVEYPNERISEKIIIEQMTEYVTDCGKTQWRNDRTI